MSSGKELFKIEWQVMNVCWCFGQVMVCQVYEVDDELCLKDY